MGASQAAFMALNAAFLQEIIPDAIRGRAMSVYMVSLGGVMALFNLVNGFLADDVGAPVLLTIAALAFLGISGRQSRPRSPSAGSSPRARSWPPPRPDAARRGQASGTITSKPSAQVGR